VNDKGQVVIPADARSTIDLQAGDKLLVMVHPSKEGLVLIKPDGLEAYAKKMLEKLSNAKESFK
jgi:AbrB family looped-hinge helix DNA binding protein